jgi:hypothetical protein
MQRTNQLAALSLAALFALTSCSSPSGDAPEPSDGTTTTAASSAPGTGEAGSGSYSSEDLATMLGTVTEADGAALQIIPTDQIEESMEQARQFLDGVSITPEECAVFVSNSLEVPEGAGYATGVSSASGDAVQTIVSLSSSSDTDFTQDRIDASAGALDACSSFTLEAQGVAIDQTVGTVDAVTAADQTFGSVTLQSSSDGARQETMTIIGTRGDVAVTAVRTAGETLPAGTQDELQDLVDATLAAIG